MVKNEFVSTYYKWIVLIMGILVVFGALGLARYGYSMVLPEMQTDLNMDNAQAGMVATFNLAGYLAFALIGGAIAARVGIRSVVVLGLILTGGGMILTGMADGVLPVAGWRGVTGLGSGAANVAVMGLWAAWFSSRMRGLASGIAVAGSSLGLIFTGLFVPNLIAEYGLPAWRISWYIFGGITLLLAAASYIVLRNNPGELGLNDEFHGKELEKELEKEDKHGDNDSIKEHIKKTKRNKKNSITQEIEGDRLNESFQNTNSSAISSSWKQIYLAGPVWSLGFVYAAFGFSYIIYMTFFVNFLVGEYGYTASGAGNLYMVMGWISILCGIIWGTLSDIIGRKNTLVILFLIHAVSFGLFAFGDGSLYFTISAVLFGLSAWSIPAIMAAACGDMLGSKYAPAALGFITLFFGIGQATGPMVGGSIADYYGSFSSSFLLAAVVALLGALSSALLLREKSKTNVVKQNSNSYISRPDP